VSPFTTRLREPVWLGIVILVAFAALAWPTLTSFGLTSSWWVAVAGLVLLNGVVVLGDRLMRRLRVEASGLLTVRGLFGRGAAVDLSQLAAVEVGTRTTTRGTLRTPSQLVEIDVLRLRDATGGEAVLEPGDWRDPERILDAVRTAATARGLRVIGGERFGLPGP
jgi:hypothetical protein